MAPTWMEDYLGPMVGILSVLVLWKYLLDMLPSSRTTRAVLSPRTVVIVVLGDISQSPRMMYHAASLARHDYYVHIVSYQGKGTLPKMLRQSNMQHITLVPISSFSSLQTKNKILFVILGLIRIGLLAMSLLYALLFRIAVPPALMLVQIPPSVPTLPIVKLVAWIRGSHVIIDWHNTMHSMVALRLGRSSSIVKLLKRLESFFGSSAYVHLCVSRAMRRKLTSEFELKGNVVTFYDRPPSSFHHQSPRGIHAAFSRWTFWRHDLTLASILPHVGNKNSTPLTVVPKIAGLGASPILRPDRPAIVVSSTSWTDDEDFGLFISALTKYDEMVSKSRKASTASSSKMQMHDISSKNAAHQDSVTGDVVEDENGSVNGNFAYSSSDEEDAHGTINTHFPNLLVLITGKGPGRSQFESKIAELEKSTWKHVRVRCLWLSRSDYPVLLGCADLGVSLHYSSSGVDLPMKVVDMFGCGVPVLAYLFQALPELVQDNVNGLVFSSADDLFQGLVKCLRGFPRNRDLLSDLSQGITQTRYNGQPWNNWEASWDSTILPLLIG